MKSQKYSGKQRRPNLLLVRRVSGDSMFPTLRHGQIIAATSLFGALSPGDIVIIRHHGLEKIKRIAKIEHDRLYVTGDNTAQSTDSRTFGWLNASTVLAKVIWPLKK